MFDIEQGVGIGLFVKRNPGRSDAPAASVRHADVWGERKAKYEWLISHGMLGARAASVAAAEPFYLFEPFEQSGAGDYFAWPSIGDVMPVNGVGIVTARDHIVIDYERQPIIERVLRFRNSQLSDEAVCEELEIPLKKGWDYKRARRDLKQLPDIARHMKRILYRPFDSRHFFCHGSLVWRTVDQIMGHMLAGENAGLIFMRQVAQGDSYTHFGVSRMPVDNRAFYSNTGIMSVARSISTPMLAEATHRCSASGPWVRRGVDRTRSGFVEAVVSGTGLPSSATDGGSDTKTFGPEDVSHTSTPSSTAPSTAADSSRCSSSISPACRPWSASNPSARSSRSATNYSRLHLLESPALETPITTYRGPKSPAVDKVSFSNGTVWLDKTKSVGFEGVPEEVWNFHIGGYQVCHKWLKDRKGHAHRRGHRTTRRSSSP